MVREDPEPANARRAASGRPLSLGLVQLAVGEDPTRNLAGAADAIADAAARGAEVICLPELFAHRYPCQREDTAHFDLAEPLGGAHRGPEAAIRSVDEQIDKAFVELAGSNMDYREHRRDKFLAIGRDI